MKKGGGEENNAPRPGEGSDVASMSKDFLDGMTAGVQGPPAPPTNIGDRFELLADGIDKAVGANEAKKARNTPASDQQQNKKNKPTQEKYEPDSSYWQMGNGPIYSKPE